MKLSEEYNKIKDSYVKIVFKPIIVLSTLGKKLMKQETVENMND